MTIIEPFAELIDDINAADVYSKIERCGRVCYQSQPCKNDAEPCNDSARNDATFPDNHAELCKAADFVRKLIKRGHESVLEHVSLTWHIVCDRAIMAELTRHRLASFSVESTRYVKYNELTFIKQFNNDAIGETFTENVAFQADENYTDWLRAGAKPEQARAVLPLCLKTELYMTANLRELRHILKLRTAPAAHPQMRFIANQILNILRDKLPVIVEDIGGIEHEDND